MDAKLFFIDRGSGEPLVLLHGNGENLLYFTPQIEYFEKDYRVIAVDTRGHGKSERGKAPFNLSQFADDLLYLVNSLDLEKINLLGFSDGANIAIIFALKYPDKLKSLILCGANLYPSGVKAAFQLPVIFSYLFAKLKSYFSLQANAKKELLSLMVREPHIKESELLKIEAPTLVIAGTKDLIKDSHTKLIADSIKNAKFKIIEGSHFVSFENSGDFNAAVEEFLKEQDKPPVLWR
ncbi:MAG: alpha/beta hydrolase [Bacillota bacterium]|nr:alpha/beta hydrolase [Bacillota bacterium]